jgi:hypothetical protein
MLFALVGLVRRYFLLQIIRHQREPPRSRRERQLETSIHARKNLYANFCWSCHGKMGLGLGENSTEDASRFRASAEHPAFKYDNVEADPAKLQSQLATSICASPAQGEPCAELLHAAWATPRVDRQRGAGPAAHQLHRPGSTRTGGIATIRDLSKARRVAPMDRSSSIQAGAGTTRRWGCCTRSTAPHATASSRPDSPIPQAPNLAKYGIEGPLNDENKRAKGPATPTGCSSGWRTRRR